MSSCCTVLAVPGCGSRAFGRRTGSRSQAPGRYPSCYDRALKSLTNSTEHGKISTRSTAHIRHPGTSSPPFVCVEGAGPGREPHDDREAARSHAGADDRAVRSSSARFHPDRRGTGHREHRRESHPQTGLLILSHIAPLPGPSDARPAVVPPRIDGAMFCVSEHCAPGSAGPAPAYGSGNRALCSFAAAQALKTAVLDPEQRSILDSPSDTA